MKNKKNANMYRKENKPTSKPINFNSQLHTDSIL